MEKGKIYNEYNSLLVQYNQLAPSDQTEATRRNIRTALNRIANIYAAKVSEQDAKDAAKPTWKIPWKGIAIAVAVLGVAIWYANSSAAAGLQDSINEEPKAPVESPTSSEQTSPTPHIDKFYFICRD